MELLQINPSSNTLMISPMALTIPEFSAVWDSDDSKTKDRAVKELSFIYFIADYKSPYIGYTDNNRFERVVKDIFKTTAAEYKIPPYLITAVRKYNELQISSSPSMTMLKSAQRAIAKITDFFDNVDISRDEKGTKMSTLIKTLSSLDSVVKGLATLEMKISTETETQGRARGGGQVGMREMPRNKRSTTKQ